MQISNHGLDFICSYEGFSATSYVDPISKAEPITIGYGTTIYPNGIKVKLSDMPVSKDEAKTFIKHDLIKIETFLNSLNLNQNQFDSCCSFCYNIGLGGFKNSTLFGRIKSNTGDIEEAFLMWNRSCGRIVDGLTRRRKAEANLFLSDLNEKINSNVNLYISSIEDENERLILRNQYTNYLSKQIELKDISEQLQNIIKNG